MPVACYIASQTLTKYNCLQFCYLLFMASKPINQLILYLLVLVTIKLNFEPHGYLVT